MLSRRIAKRGMTATDRNYSTDEIVIRSAMAEEAGAIVSLLHRAFAQYDDVLAPRSGAMDETAATVAARLRDEGCLVALAGATPVGCVFYKPLGEAIYFGRLAIVPERRGQGLAPRLIAEVETVAAAAGAAAVTLGVRIKLPGNIALFTALGYREIAREAHPGFSEPTSLTMEKRLRGKAHPAAS
jgi:predicted N-acetyltransferase YhbS